MKILGTGLGRTGTLSLHHALLKLGYNSIHWAPERLADIIDGSNNQPDFKRYDDVEAVTDLPAAYFYNELKETYPNLLFIHTIRNPSFWFRSIKVHYKIAIKNKQRWCLQKYVYGSEKPTPFLYKKKFEEYNRQVISDLEGANLLIMDITKGDGWEKLCPFLDKEVPNESFPHYNKLSSRKKSILI